MADDKGRDGTLSCPQYLGIFFREVKRSFTDWLGEVMAGRANTPHHHPLVLRAKQSLALLLDFLLHLLLLDGI